MASIAPGSGSTNGGTPVTIVAPNVVPGAAATLGGNALAGVAVSGNVMTGTTPPHAPGPVSIVLTNPSGLTGSLVNGFTYTCPAIVLGPATLPAGTQGVAYNQTVTQSGSLWP